MAAILKRMIILFWTFVTIQNTVHSVHQLYADFDGDYFIQYLVMNFQRQNTYRHTDGKLYILRHNFRSTFLLIMMSCTYFRNIAHELRVTLCTVP